MSHFSVYVVVPEEAMINDDAAAIIEDNLARYSEEKEVPEYDRKCYCVGKQAEWDAKKIAGQIIGTIDELRDKFHETIRPKIRRRMNILPESKQTRKYLKMHSKEVKEYNDMLDKEWEKFLEPFNIEMAEALKLHPMKGKPAPDCTECNGTGTHKSTYNPDSKWDWYCIGGRWSGFINGKEYNEDEDIKKNSIKVKNLLKVYKERISYALVDSNGDWHEKGQMGWFGVSSNENSDWPKGFKKLLEKENPDDYVVCVDCHI